MLPAQSSKPFLTVPIFKLNHSRWQSDLDCNVAIVPTSSGLHSFLNGGSVEFAGDHLLCCVSSSKKLYLNFVYREIVHRCRNFEDKGLSVYVNRVCFNSLAPECLEGLDVVGLQLVPKSSFFGINLRDHAFWYNAEDVESKQVMLLDVAGSIQWMVDLADGVACSPRYDGRDITRLLDDFILAMSIKRLVVTLRENVLFSDCDGYAWIFTPMVIQDNCDVRCMDAARLTQNTKHHVYASEKADYVFQCPETKSVSAAQTVYGMPSHVYHVQQFDWREYELHDEYDLVSMAPNNVPEVLDGFVTMCRTNCFWGSCNNVISSLCGMLAAHRHDWLRHLRERLEKQFGKDVALPRFEEKGTNGDAFRGTAALQERAEEIEPWLKATIPELYKDKVVLKRLCKNNGIYLVYLLVCLWKMKGVLEFRKLALVRNLFFSNRGQRVFVDVQVADHLKEEDEEEEKEEEQQAAQLVVDDDPYGVDICFKKARYVADWCFGGEVKKRDRQHVQRVMLKSGLMFIFQLDFLRPGFCPISLFNQLLYRTETFDAINNATVV